MRSKKVISLLLVFVLTLGSSIGVFADNANTNNNKAVTKDTKVYHIDKNGNKVESDLSYSFFKELSENGKASLPNDNSSNGDVHTDSYPLPDDGAVMVSSSVYKSFTNKNYNTQVDLAVATLFGVVWGRLKGSLIKVTTKAQILQNEWLDSFGGAVFGYMLSSASDFAKASPTYLETYQYKLYSDYDDCYKLYNVLVFYSDSAYKNPIEVQYWEVYNYDDEVAGTL